MLKKTKLKTLGIVIVSLVLIMGLSGCATVKCILSHVKSKVLKYEEPDYDFDNISDDCDSDDDNDNIPDVSDICPQDEDNDKDGDEFCAGTGFSSPKIGDKDNCPDTSNANQADNVDEDGIGDACDDTDWDGILDIDDDCPFDPNNDMDQDGVCANLPNICGMVGEICLNQPTDLCPSTPSGEPVDVNGCSPSQNPAGVIGEKPPCTGQNCPPGHQVPDTDDDGKPDAEEPAGCVGLIDCDSDGVNDGSDNCIDIENGPNSGTCIEGSVTGTCTTDDGCGAGGLCSKDQENADNDMLGDACDDDDDDDGKIDVQDNCRVVANFDQADQDCDGIGDFCDNDRDGDGLDVAAESAIGTDPTSADTDADGLSDGPLKPDPGCGYTYNPSITGVNDPYPTGDPVWTIVFEVWEGSTDITDKWLPKPNQVGYATVVSLTTPDYLSPPRDNPALPSTVPWVEKSQVKIVATLKDPSDNPKPFVNDVIFTIDPYGSSQKAGVAINDDTEICSPDCANDFSFDSGDRDLLSKPAPKDNPTVDLFSFDYGGWVRIIATTHLANGSEVTGEVTLPLDTDGDNLPDIWEAYHSVAGFDKLNKNSFSQNLSDGNEDIDESLSNIYGGDGIVNYREYRGIVRDNNNGTVVQHMRLNPMMKDLFVRGDNFKNSIPASTTVNVLNFSVSVPGGSAFEEARIAVHDVTGMLSFIGPTEPPNIDILVVENVTHTTVNEKRDDNGYIDQCGAARCWSWDYKGVSYSGQTDVYSYDPTVDKKGTFLYHLNLMHYVYNRPYRDEVIDINYPGWSIYQTPLNYPNYVNLLDPVDLVEDVCLENGIGPESIRQCKENIFRKDQRTVLDGDHMMTGWSSNPQYVGAESYEVGYDFSVFDADGDGLVENPPVADALTITKEYTKDWLQLHTTIHEMGHGTGIYLELYDEDCVMDEATLNWDRAGHFSDFARSLILIHNQTEF
jgi:hypothetical protein